MSKATTFFLALLLFSCANSNKEPLYDAKTVSEEDALESVSGSENFTVEKVVSEKLTAYFELLKLKRKYPEFKQDIVLQLKEFSRDEFANIDHQGDFSIENIRMTSAIATHSDSVRRMKVYYDLVSENLVKTDSMNALITTKTILLDEVPTKSAKITFSRID